jgi:hypothetical protein
VSNLVLTILHVTRDDKRICVLDGTDDAKEGKKSTHDIHLFGVQISAEISELSVRPSTSRSPNEEQVAIFQVARLHRAKPKPPVIIQGEGHLCERDGPVPQSDRGANIRSDVLQSNRRELAILGKNRGFAHGG